jgi:Tetratricopeptide repeat
MRIGEFLIGRGVVTPSQVNAALERQRCEGGRLGNHLVAIGALTVEQLLATLRAQQEAEAGLKLCRHALERSQRTYGPYHDNTYRARFNLARALLAAGYAGDAILPAQSALEGHQRALGRNHVWTREAAEIADDARRAVARAGEGMAETGANTIAALVPAGDTARG